jgi:prevent-host-death family protein
MSYNAAMERVGLRELNQNASRVIARVRAGVIVEVTVRGKPVARLVPIEPRSGLLERMIREGRATPATATGPIPMPPDLGDSDVNVADEIVRMREEEPW